MRRMRLTKLILLLLIVVLVFPVYTVYGQSKEDLEKVIQLAESERSIAYLNTTFETLDWKAGQVISNYPYSVVIKAEKMADDIAFQLQIWRGTAERVDNDLFTDWELLNIDANGKVVSVIFNIQRVIWGYFKTATQNQYKSVLYADSYPWANLPTDLEARTAKVDKIPDDGLIDTYHVLPKDGTATISTRSDDVKQQQAVPEVLPVNPIEAVKRVAFPNIVINKIPKDIKNHWAQSYIIDLMKKSILNGYKDQTIRPNKILSHAEFTTILVHALRLIPDTSAASNYEDIKGHWSEKDVKLAVQAGLIIEDSPTFKPDSAITRLETVRMLGKALLVDPVEEVDTEKMATNYKDLLTTTTEDVENIQALSALGIISGDLEGNFRPNDSLTRAEACKVISAFLHMQKGE